MISREGSGDQGLLEYKEGEDMESLSQVQSKLQPNLELLSKFRTAAPCGANSETLTTSNEESPIDKVVDLFVLFTKMSEFALFGFRMTKLWSKY